MALTAGDTAPDFSLPGPDGQTLSLGALRGRKVALFFYPKADTPACTTESLDFSSLKEAFEKTGTAVIGISRDPVRAITRFRDKHGLAVGLATDEAGAMVEAYGVWVEKSMYGRSYMGLERATFLIDAEGKIAQVWRKVKVKGHAAEVLAAAEAL